MEALESQKDMRRHWQIVLSVIIAISLLFSTRSPWCMRLLASDTARVSMAAEEAKVSTAEKSSERLVIDLGQTGMTAKAAEEAAQEEAAPEEPTPEEIIEQQRNELPASAWLEVPTIYQEPELPTGCESVALTMDLNYLGYGLDKTTIASEYLIYSAESIAEGYMGSPFSYEGAGIFPPGLVNTANDFLAAQGAEQQAHNLSGTGFYDLYAYIAAGYPVLIWTTMYYEYPISESIYAESDGYTYEWYMNEHCVVLGGYDQNENTVTVFDSMRGEVVLNADAMQSIYDAIGQYAMTIY